MLLYSKTLCFGVALWLLAACGFQPLYGSRGSGSAVEAALADIQITLIKDRAGQQLHNYLLDRLNPRGAPARPRFVLSVVSTISKTELGIERDETATRAKLSLSAKFELKDIASQRILTAGAARSTNSFNIVDSDFATLSAEKDAIDRAARVVSEEIKTRLSLYLNRFKDPAR
ncbi:MAG: LPS assembly lipoprotein LptE [Alphaproteobacteria bacterium]|jgi:LPS-assembly lipoprotein